MLSFGALFFDLGNTLIYFEGDWSEVSAEANETLIRHLKTAGLELNFNAFLAEYLNRLQTYKSKRETEFIEYSTAYIIRTLLNDWGYSGVPDSLIRSALKAVYGVSQGHWHTEDDTHNTLRTLREQGYRLAIISNAGDDEDVQTLVDKANIRSYFEVILSSAAAGIRKPDPRIFEMVIGSMNMMDIPRSRMAMIGDMLGADILGAREAGLFSVWITRRAGTHANRAHIDTIKPNLVISALAELPKLLGKLNEGE